MAPARSLGILLSILIFLAPGRASETDAAVVYLAGDDSIAIGQEFREGATVQTNNGLTLRLPDGSHVELAEKTAVTLARIAKAKNDPVTLKLSRGSIRATVPSRPGSVETFRVTTPIAAAGVRGTDFSVSYEPGAPTAIAVEEPEADVDVFEGEVDVFTEDGRLEAFSLRAGEGVSASRRALKRRKAREEVRERWEAVREKMIDHLQRRFRFGEDEMDPDLKDFLQKLPPQAREEIKAKVRDRIQKKVKLLRERRETERKSTAERLKIRKKVKENRRGR